MSVSAVVLRSPTAPPKSVAGYLPVATQSDFASYWLPLADAGGLGLLRNFEPGIALKRQDLPIAIQQLGTFRELITSSALAAPVERHLLSRVDSLRALLADADDDAMEEVFIG